MNNPSEKKPVLRFVNFNDAWEQRKLFEISELITVGIANSATQAYSTDGIVMFRNQNIKENYLDDSDIIHITEAFEEKYIKKRLKADDLLIARTGYPGTACVVPNKYEGSQTFTTLIARMNKDSVNPYFVCQYINSDIGKAYFESTQIGGGQKNSGAGILEKMPILLPTSLSEQSMIADFLSLIDKTITLHQRKLQSLQDAKKSMLQKMFPKDGELFPELRFSGFADPWEQRKFGDIAQRQSESAFSDDENPSIEYEDVISGAGTLNKNVFEKPNSKKGIKFTSDDVLYGKLRPYLHNWLNPDFPGVAIGDWWVLRPVSADKNFLYRLIQTPQYDDAANQSSGTKMPRADWKHVSSIEFMIPSSIEEQSQIADIFDNLDNLITLHQRKLEQLNSIKKALLQKMFV